MTIKTDLNKLAHLHPADWILLAQTFIYLGLIRVAIAMVSFQRLAGWIGLSSGEKITSVTEAQVKASNRIGWAINAAANRTIWDNACLTQSLTGAWMIHRKKIPVTIYLGVAKNFNNQEFAAHAWLRCGETIVTGGGELERFNVIAVFSSTFRRSVQ